MKCRAVLAYPGDLALRRRCKLPGISRSAFYAWCRRPPSRRGRMNGRLVTEMIRIHRAVDRCYGSPRMRDELVAGGFGCGTNRVARLMREYGIRAKQVRRYRPTTDSAHPQPVAPNLLDRQCAVAAPNQVWASDVTYIWTREGWLYLEVVMDLFSRRIVGWHLAPRLTCPLVLEALQGRLADATSAPWVAASLGSGKPIRESRLSVRPRTGWCPLQHEPQGQLLGQRGRGEFLSFAQDGTHSPPSLQHARRSVHGCARLH